MKKTLVVLLTLGLLLSGTYLYAASGDLIVNGALGIGYSNPLPKLQVKATTNGNSAGFDGTVSIGPGMTGYDDQNQTMLQIRSTTTGTRHDALMIQNNLNQTLLDVRDDGNIGIGMFSTTQKLSVAGTIQSTTGGFMFPDGTTQTTAYRIPAGDLTDVNGNIGIGISQASQRLSVAGTIQSLSGGVMFPDGSTQTTAYKVPSNFITSSGLNVNINVPAVLYGGLTVAAPFEVAGDSVVTGNEAVYGTLTVSSAVVSNTLAVSGNATINGILTAGSATVSNTLAVGTGGINFPDGSTLTTGKKPLIWDFTPQPPPPPASGGPIVTATSPTLDGLTDGGYEFEWVIIPACLGAPGCTLPRFRMFFETDTTPSNYRRGVLSAISSVAAAANTADCYLDINQQVINDTIIITGQISISPNGFVTARFTGSDQSDSAFWTGTINKIASVPNLTRVTIVTTTTGGAMGLGSRFRMWKKL